MLRLAAALLLLGNLAFLAWSQGWLVAAGSPNRHGLPPRCVRS